MVNAYVVLFMYNYCCVHVILCTVVNLRIFVVVDGFVVMFIDFVRLLVCIVIVNKLLIGGC